MVVQLVSEKLAGTVGRKAGRPAMGSPRESSYALEGVILVASSKLSVALAWAFLGD